MADFLAALIGLSLIPLLLLAIVRGIVRIVLRYKRPPGAKFIGPGDGLLVLLALLIGVLTDILTTTRGTDDALGGIVVLIGPLAAIPIFVWEARKHKLATTKVE